MNGIYHYAPGAIITKFFDLDMAVFFVFGDEGDFSVGCFFAVCGHEGQIKAKRQNSSKESQAMQCMEITIKGS